jgi:hypothetical protein
MPLHQGGWRFGAGRLFPDRALPVKILPQLVQMPTLVVEVATLRSEMVPLLFQVVVSLLELGKPMLHLSVLEFAVFHRSEEAAQKALAGVERDQPEALSKPPRAAPIGFPM